MSNSKLDPNERLTVEEVALALRITPNSVSRKIREGRLLGRKLDPAREKSPWYVERWEIERYLRSMETQTQLRARQERLSRARARGMVVGYGADFDEQMAASPNPPEIKQDVRGLVDKHAVFERLQREMFSDPDLRARLDEIDEESRIEAEAQELAKRTRRDERIRRRALEILDDDEDADR